MRDLEATQSQLEDLRSIREKLEHDNRKLREEIKYLEDAQSKQRRPASGGRSDDQQTAILILRKENEVLKHETRSLKDRVQQLNHELDAALQH